MARLTKKTAAAAMMAIIRDLPDSAVIEVTNNPRAATFKIVKNPTSKYAVHTADREKTPTLATGQTRRSRGSRVSEKKAAIVTDPVIEPDDSPAVDPDPIKIENSQ